MGLIRIYASVCGCHLADAEMLPNQGNAMVPRDRENLTDGSEAHYYSMSDQYCPQHRSAPNAIDQDLLERMKLLLPEGEGWSSIDEYCRHKLSNSLGDDLLNALPEVDSTEPSQAAIPIGRRPEISAQLRPRTFTLPIHTKEGAVPGTFALSIREKRPETVPKAQSGANEPPGLGTTRPQLELPFRFVTRPATGVESKEVVLVAELKELSKQNLTIAQASASAQESGNAASPFASLKPVFLEKEGRLWK